MNSEDSRWIAGELVRPCVLFKPRLFIDGNMWCALYGDDLQSGIAGFGESPDKAMREFDEAWRTPRPQTGEEKGQ